MVSDGRADGSRFGAGAKPRANYDVDPYANASTENPSTALAVMCPNPTCDTELIILPEHAGAWVVCPTCGLRFIAPEPDSPDVVTEADVRKAVSKVTSDDEVGLARALDVLSRTSIVPRPAPSEDSPAAQPGSLPRAKAAPRKVSPPAPAQGPRVVDAAQPSASPTGGAAEGLAPVAEPPEALRESEAADALDSLDRASVKRTPVRPLGSAGKRPAVCARPVAGPLAASRVYADLEGASGAQSAQVRGVGRRADLALIWAVSLIVAAGIVGAAFALGIPDLALGAVLFVGFAVVKAVSALRRRRDGGMSY